jgi:hypothetical protein
MAPTIKKSQKKLDIILSVLAMGKSATAAAAAAGITRDRLYVWRKKDPQFAAAWAGAIEAGTDLLEDEARRRASEGTAEPVFWKGEIVATVPKFSDSLIIFLLKSRRPEKYRDYQSNPEKNALDELLAALKQ